MIQYMQDYAGVDFDYVMDFIENTSFEERVEFNKTYIENEKAKEEMAEATVDRNHEARSGKGYQRRKD